METVPKFGNEVPAFVLFLFQQETASEGGVMAIPCRDEIDYQKKAALAQTLQIQFEPNNLPCPGKGTLVSHILAKWGLTAHWLMHDPENRYTAYPFTLPKVREFVAVLRPWFEYQEATFNLFSIAWSRAKFEEGDRMANPVLLYGQHVNEYRQADIEAVLNDGADSSASVRAKTALKAIADYEAWLINGYSEGKQSSASTIGIVLNSVRSLATHRSGTTLKKKGYPSVVQEWLRASRKWWRFVGKGKRIGLLFADEEGVKTKDGRYPRLILPVKEILEPLDTSGFQV